MLSEPYDQFELKNFYVPFNYKGTYIGVPDFGDSWTNNQDTQAPEPPIVVECQINRSMPISIQKRPKPRSQMKEQIQVKILKEKSTIKDLSKRFFRKSKK